MGVRDAIVKLVRQGLTLSQIVENRGTTHSTIRGYLYQKVGDGTIKISDIVFNTPSSIRDSVEEAITKYGVRGIGRVAEFLKKKRSATTTKILGFI